MNINGILSIIVALAMMLSGGFNADQPEALSARTLTLRDVTIVKGEDSVQLTPSISMGAMSENGEAVLDFHIETEEGKIFPVQLAVDEEKATLSLVKSGKSFSISNDTIVKLLKDAGVDLDSFDPANFDLQKILENLYQQMIADMDADEKAIFDQMIKDLLPKVIELFAYLKDPANQAQLEADMAGVVQEMRTITGEGTPGVIEHGGKEYNVTTYEYTLDYDTLIGLTDKIYTANEKMREFYDSYFAFINLVIDQQNREIESLNQQMMEGYTAAEADAAVADSGAVSNQTHSFGESSLSFLQPVNAPAAPAEVPAPASVPTPMPTVAPVESFADLYAMIDADIDMTMECKEVVSDDGEYVSADVAVSFSFPGMDNPVEYTVTSLQVGEDASVIMDCAIEQGGEYMNMKFAVNQRKDENNFAVAMEMGEIEEDYVTDETTGESELVISTEALVNLTVSMGAALNPETGKTEYAGGIMMASEDGEAVVSAEGETDKAGNSATTVFAGYAEDGEETSVSFVLETSAEPFENIAANMDNTEITSGLIDIFTGKASTASIGIIGGADGPTSVYTADSGVSFNEGGSFFGNLQPGATPEPTISPEEQAMADLQTDLEAVIASFQSDLIALMADESVKDAASLITLGYIYEEPAEEDDETETYAGSSSLIEAVDSEPAEEYAYEAPAADGEYTSAEPTSEAINPQFGYIPEGYQMDETESDLEYGSYSYSFTNPENYDAIYVSLYVSDYYEENKTYISAADGSFAPVEGRIVEVEDEGDGTLYAEIEDGAVNVGISVYDEDFSMDEMAKFIAGITY